MIKMQTPSITVRFVEDTKEDQCWFEEKLPDDQWAILPSTKMSCIGNSRHELNKIIEQRRQKYRESFIRIGPEEVISIE